MKTLTKFSLLALLAFSCAVQAVVVPTQTADEGKQQQEQQLEQAKFNRGLYAGLVAVGSQLFLTKIYERATLTFWGAAGLTPSLNKIGESFYEGLATPALMTTTALTLGYIAYKAFDVEKNKAWGKNKKRNIALSSLAALTPLAIGAAKVAIASYRS